MKHTVKIKSIKFITHDVLRIVMEKPKGFSFEPGQATEVSINKPGWEEEGRPFTFTSLPNDADLEFTIKTYPDHDGVTNRLRSLEPEDELILTDIFGTINYKGEGVFIAGGAGVTPFISIFRSLKAKNKIGDNKLIFANKTKEDIINKDEWDKLLGDNFINILSDEKTDGFKHGYITSELIEQIAGGTNGYFYLCGPPPMMEAVEKNFAGLNIPEENIVKEGM